MIKSQSVPRLTVVMSKEQKNKLIAAAKLRGLALSSWVRLTLMDAAIASHSAPIANAKKYIWLGKACSKEVYEAGMAQKKKNEEELNRGF